MRPAFVFDQERCTGCEACRVACAIENGRDLGWRRIHTFNPARHADHPTRHLSLACNHCEKPACLLGCPSGAYRRDEATGAVLLDEAKCVGCRYCSWLCPYDVPRFDGEAGVMTKCTFCAPRLAEGRAPACAQACPTGALGHAARADNGGEPRLSGLPAAGLGPALVVKPPRPSLFSRAGAEAPPPDTPRPERRIRLRSEWALLLFTLAVPLLVGWFAAGVFHPAVAPPPAAILAIGAAALAVSGLHLGRPLRAWRAAANVRTSGLAREVVLVPLFVASATVARLVPSRALDVLALALGTAALVSIDVVYRAVPRLGRSSAWRRSHSSEACLTAMLFAALLAGAPLVFVPLAAVKVALSLAPTAGAFTRVPVPLSVLRVLLLVLACAAALAGAVPLAAALALAGEALDRARFYLELEPIGPARLLAEAA